MNILVTGGAGFIGSHVVDAFRELGHTVHVLDDLSTGRRANLPVDVPLHEASICAPRVRQIFEQHRFEVLVHHAAQLDVRVSVNDPAADAEINILGFLNLMEAGRDNGLQKVIFASTGGAIYGEPEYVGQDEDHPIRPLSPYGITKLATEKYLDFYRHAYGIDHVCLRYANVYGPRQGLTGEAGVVAIFTQRLLRGETPIIYGDGQQTRDFTYVGDVVRANCKALEYQGSGVFNIGTNQETSIRHLYQVIETEFEHHTPPRYARSRPGEQERSVLSYDRAARELDWEPGIGLKAGISQTVAWFRSFEEETPSCTTSSPVISP